LEIAAWQSEIVAFLSAATGLGAVFAAPKHCEIDR